VTPVESATSNSSREPIADVNSSRSSPVAMSSMSILDSLTSVDSFSTVSLPPYKIEVTRARLAGGLEEQGEGRVEVMHQGQWGTVCKTLFNSRAATVICRMMGYSGEGTYTYSRFGSGEGPIWLSSVICTGNEASIDQCQHDDWNINNCQHKDDVSISCS
jgi:hypothetical protein